MPPIPRQHSANALNTTQQRSVGGAHPLVSGRGAPRPKPRPLGAAALVAALILCQGLAGAALAAARPGAAVGTPSHPLPQSSEALASRSPWSRPESYPLSQQPRAALYRPSAEWIGRLVLPTTAEVAAPGAPNDDWVWIVVEQAPQARRELIGQRLRLRWADRPQLRRYVAMVTTTIHLDGEARQAAKAANVVPTRLAGRRVGPLQSLAGARPSDDVSVSLEEVAVGDGELRLARLPTQITGRWQALVTLVAAADGEGLWRARHFNRASGRFDGASETIRIPALPPDRFGRRLLDPAGLARSPHNGQGWLIQGAPARDGVFTVQALLPYAWLRIQPQRTVRGTDPALAFVHHTNWSAEQLKRGSLHSTALVPANKPPPPWTLGERALLMHLFGGIGGQDGEAAAGWTVTGHFAFGEAQVVRDAFTGQPRLALRYHQIYATNPNGIVAGSQDWSAYAGSLQRGWIGLRPFSDVLVPIGGAVLDAVALQAEILAARYRSGDGSGVAPVTPSTSCVQDSGQALWIAIRQLREEGDAIPMSAFDRERLRELGLAFDHLLKPFGRVRGDWAHNAALALAAGTGSASTATTPRPGATLFATSQSFKDALLTWRSMFPRPAHDLFAAEFLRVGLPLLVLRSNQIPGADPRLQPLAPTGLFGQLPLVSALLSRLGDSLFPEWTPAGRAWGLAALIGFVAGALAFGWRRVGLLPFVFLQEVVFRGLLLPSVLDGVGPLAMVPWLALSVAAFVAWRGLRIQLKGGALHVRRPDPRLAIRLSLLGTACALAYVVSGSLWPAVLIHWLVGAMATNGENGEPA